MKIGKRTFRLWASLALGVLFVVAQSLGADVASPEAQRPDRVRGRWGHAGQDVPRGLHSGVRERDRRQGRLRDRKRSSSTSHGLRRSRTTRSSTPCGPHSPHTTAAKRPGYSPRSMKRASPTSRTSIRSSATASASRPRTAQSGSSSTPRPSPKRVSPSRSRGATSGILGSRDASVCGPWPRPTAAR